MEEGGSSQDVGTQLLSDVPSDDIILLNLSNPLIREVSGTNSESESNSNEDNSDCNFVCDEFMFRISIQHIFIHSACSRSKC